MKIGAFGRFGDAVLAWFVGVVFLPPVARAEDRALGDAASSTTVVHFTSRGREQDVKLTTADDAAREEATGDEASPIAECRTPCALRLRQGRYELTAGGRRVRTYRAPLDVPAGESHVAIRAASKGAFVTGVVLTGLGGVMTAIPVGFGVAGLLSAPGDDYNQFMAGMNFGIAALVGLPMLITGIVLCVTNPSRGFEVTSRPR